MPSGAMNRDGGGLTLGPFPVEWWAWLQSVLHLSKERLADDMEDHGHPAFRVGAAGRQRARTHQSSVWRLTT